MSAAATVVGFGCRLNLVESDEIAALLGDADRDLAVVNTCAVTAEAVRQGRQAIRRLWREAPGRPIAVTGCAAEIDPAGFAAMPEVAHLVRNRAKTDPAAWPHLRPASTAPATSPAGTHTRGFVEIQNGCDHRCTFCVIPFGRGASRSIPRTTILARARALVDAGVAEIVLTGVDITSYGRDDRDGGTLGDLCRELLRALPDLARLRLSSIDCIEADPALLDCIAAEPRFMPHLHLSLQSGSDMILKRMKRRHGRDDAIGFCRTVRTLRPDIVLGADIIAGFPTETEAMFDDSLTMVEACGITHLHVFPYSARPGTPAARMPQIPRGTARARAVRLRRAGEILLGRHLAAQVGQSRRVLMERGGRGRTEDFTAVRVDAPPPAGRFADVLIKGHDGRELAGTVL